ncbi:hypothetical protein ABZ942_01330 [Nocardia sp. NPDC046473]|uniref:hypothetical protein n=1 Tax=Nocardia sp. NPDC046473 TaxID=3155733 RepID=UPI0033D3B899
MSCGKSLRDVHGDRYHACTAEVGRFIPAVGGRPRETELADRNTPGDRVTWQRIGVHAGTVSVHVNQFDDASTRYSNGVQSGVGGCVVSISFSDRRR